MQLIKKNLIKYKKSSDEGFENFPAIISDAAGADSLPIGAEILIDNDADVPNGWEVVDEKYDASEVYLTNGQSVQEKLDNIAPTGVTSGTYGGYNSSENYYYIPNITVDEYGRVTNASISYLDYADSKGGGLVDSTFYNYVTGNSHIAYRKTLIGLSTAGYSGISLTNIQNTLVDSSSPTYLYMPTVYNVFVNCKINSNGDKAFVPVKYYCGTTSSSNTATVYVQFPSEFLEFNNKEEDMYNGGLWATYYVLYERPYTLTSYK